MTIGIHVKLGQAEINFEGEREELAPALEAIMNSLTDTPLFQNCLNDAPAVVIPSDAPDSNKPTAPEPTLSLSVAQIATSLNVDNGPSLVRASAGYLTLVAGKTIFNRGELLDAMKAAPRFCRSSYTKNLTRTILNLQKDGTLIECSKDSYCLSAEAQKKLEDQLGN